MDSFDVWVVGSLTLIKSDGSQEDRYYFLFNDILIEAIHSSSGTQSLFHTLTHTLSLLLTFSLFFWSE